MQMRAIAFKSRNEAMLFDLEFPEVQLGVGQVVVVTIFRFRDGLLPQADGRFQVSCIFKLPPGMRVAERPQMPDKSLRTRRGIRKSDRSRELAGIQQPHDLKTGCPKVLNGI